MKILLTAGATREPIDDVRFISNVSTGATGAALADAFAEAGHDVVLLRGIGAIRAAAAVDEEEFSSAEDLEARLHRRLSHGACDAVIMAAAVSDFHVVGATQGKLSSEVQRRTLELARNPKILPRLKAFSPRPLRLIGFKLTAGATDSVRMAAVSAQFGAGAVDAVVHNDLADIRANPREQHPFFVYQSAAGAPQRVLGARALAGVLAKILSP